MVAATRNMITAMDAADPGEYQLERWEGTDRPVSEGGQGGGTGIAGIVTTLNGHYSSYGPGAWKDYRAGSANKLFSHVVADISAWRAPLVENVETLYLPFWNGHDTDHYDSLHGYNYDTSKLLVAEEWNPVKAEKNVTYGNPYGYHWTSKVSIFNATTHSPSYVAGFGAVTFG